MLVGKDEQLRKSVKLGFQGVKTDINALQLRIKELEESQNRLMDKIETLRISEKNNRISESQPSLSEKELRLRIEKIAGEALKHHPTKAAASLNSAETETQKAILPKLSKDDKLKEKLLRTYERNRKDIVKQHILTEVGRGNYTKIQLRDIVVDQQKYCSKASFYRYLEELEITGQITYKRFKKQNIIKHTQTPSTETISAQGL